MKSLLIYCFFLPIGLLGQSLSFFLQASERTNLDLKKIDYDFQMAVEKKEQIDWIKDPRVDLGFFLSPVETRLGPQNLRLSISQALPNWSLKKIGTTYQEEYAKRFDLYGEDKLLEIQYEICVAYLALYEQKTKRTILERNIQLLEALQQIALSKVESGKGSTADVLRLDLQIQEWQQEIRNLQFDYTMPRAKINYLTGRAFDTPILVVDTFGVASLPEVTEELRVVLKEQLPILQNFELEQRRIEFERLINDLESKGDFSFGLDYIFLGKRTDFIPENNGRDIIQLRAGLNIPVNTNYYRSKDRTLELERKSLNVQEEAIAQQIIIEIENALDQIRKTITVHNYLVLRQKTLAASIRVLESEYSIESRAFDELLELEKELVNLEISRLSNIIDSQKWLAFLKKMKIK